LDGAAAPANSHQLIQRSRATESANQQSGVDNKWKAVIQERKLALTRRVQSE